MQTTRNMTNRKHTSKYLRKCRGLCGELKVNNAFDLGQNVCRVCRIPRGAVTVGPDKEERAADAAALEWSARVRAAAGCPRRNG